MNLQVTHDDDDDDSVTRWETISFSWILLHKAAISKDVFMLNWVHENRMGMGTDIPNKETGVL